jgi:hypothetical protein
MSHMLVNKTNINFNLTNFVGVYVVFIVKNRVWSSTKTDILQGEVRWKNSQCLIVLSNKQV